MQIRPLMANAQASTDQTLCRPAPYPWTALAGRTVNALGSPSEIYLAVIQAKQLLATVVEIKNSFPAWGEISIFEMGVIP